MNLLPPRLVAGLAWALVERKERSVARKQSSPSERRLGFHGDVVRFFGWGAASAVPTDPNFDRL